MVAIKQSNVTQFQTKAGKAIEDFLDEMSKGSDNTEIGYRSDIDKFLDKVFNKSIYTITMEELEILDYEIFKSFLNEMKKKSANSTINRCKSSIESLYKHLNKTEIIETNLAFFGFIKALPNMSNSYEVIPQEIADQYVEAAQHEKFKPIEKKWVIKMAIELGLRDTEVRELEISQFKAVGKRVYVTGYGKGNKKWIEVIDRDLFEEMISELKLNGRKKLFTLSQKNIFDMMSRFKKLLNHEDRNYTFHSFKKTSVNNTFNATGNILDAQAKGKHTKIETTQIYLQEAQLKMTGYYSLEKNLNHDLYKEVIYEDLLSTLKTMPKDLLFLLNMKLSENKE